MTRRTRAGRRCIGQKAEPTVAPVPGLAQVLETIDLLLNSDIIRVVVSVRHDDHDSELIALSQEAAEQSGITMDIESRGAALAITLSRQPRSRR